MSQQKLSSGAAIMKVLHVRLIFKTWKHSTPTFIAFALGLSQSAATGDSNHLYSLICYYLQEFEKLYFVSRDQLRHSTITQFTILCRIPLSNRDKTKTRLSIPTLHDTTSEHLQTNMAVGFRCYGDEISQLRDRVA